MTICFCPKSQNCRRCTLFVPKELSGMLHGIALSVQLHKRLQKGFWHMTQAGFLTSLHLKHGLCHRELGRITGEIAHLSVSKSKVCVHTAHWKQLLAHKQAHLVSCSLSDRQSAGTPHWHTHGKPMAHSCSTLFGALFGATCRNRNNLHHTQTSSCGGL